MNKGKFFPRVSKRNEIIEPDGGSSLVLGLAQLAELEKIALDCRIDVSKLTYTQAQQVLTIYALDQYLAQHGLALDIKLNVGGA